MTFHVMEDTPNLISVSKLVLEDGFQFHWDNKRDGCAHLVSPEGKSFKFYNAGVHRTSPQESES